MFNLDKLYLNESAWPADFDHLSFGRGATRTVEIGAVVSFCAGKSVNSGTQEHFEDIPMGTYGKPPRESVILPNLYFNMVTSKYLTSV